MRVIAGVAATLLLVTAPCLEAASRQARAQSLLEQVMQAEGLPSISVAVGKNGKIEYAAALGYANLEHGVPAGTDTVYPIGSISKTLTAVMALRLVEQDLLDLDDVVQSDCPAYPEKEHPVLVHQLLSHTAGVRHYDYRRFEEDFLNRRHFESLNEALQKFANDPLVTPPGSRYHYSSWGYVVLGCVIEGASGETYAEQLAVALRGPASMKHTRLDVVSDIVPGRAAGYTRTKAGELVNAGLFDASDRYPAGGLLSTPSDLVRFGNALLAGDLLNEASRAMMWSPATLASGESTGNGLGWDLGTDGSVHQGGTSVGASSYLYVMPDSGVVVAIIVNQTFWTERRHDLAVELAELMGSDE